MREMILNHASVVALETDREAVVHWLKDLTDGMATLVNDQVVHNSLRMVKQLHDTCCLPDFSLFDASNELRNRGFREEYLFFTRLASKVPLLTEMDEDIRDRFLSCEEQELDAPDGEPLVFCAISRGIAAGFPSAPEWDADQLKVRFDELLPDETIAPAVEEIDQLTRLAHADPIVLRHRERLRADRNPTTLWENREAAFPNLILGPGVQENLCEFAHLISTIIGKLEALDASARDWLDRGGPAPTWRTKVSPESDSVMNRPALRSARRFRSHHGKHELFEWHARFGGSGRIHLRFDPVSRKVEVGYIGPKLPV